MTILTTRLHFPPPEMADEDGLLCMGGDLGVERLLLAYENGIFPWYEGTIPLWWHPDPRFVLFPDELIISKSMQQVIRNHHFNITTNTRYLEVIKHCQLAKRKDQAGTWINEDVVEAYYELHRLGHAISFEAWKEDQLVGGLYGIKIGKVFFGESMFSLVSNASKAAFISAVAALKLEGVQIIDCQVYTPHLESLGARMIPRIEFMTILQKWVHVKQT